MPCTVRHCTYTDEGPRLDLRVLGGDGAQVGGHLGGDAGGRVLAEEGAEPLLLLGGVGREVGEGERRALEPVRDEDPVRLRAAGRRQDVRPLQRLREVPEDVVDADDALGRVGGARGVFFGVVKDALVGWLVCFPR